MPASPASRTSGRAPVIASPQHSSSSVQLVRAADQRVALERGGERRRPGDDRDGLAARWVAAARRAFAAQHALVNGQRGLARRGAELVAQQDPQLLEDAQRLGRVPGRLVDLHQQPVRGLAERRRGDRGAGRLLGGRRARGRPGAGTPRRAPRAPRRRAPSPARAAPRATHGPSQSGRNVCRSTGEHLASARGGLAPVVAVDRGLGAGGRGGRDLDDRPRSAPAGTSRSSDRPASTPSPSARRSLESSALSAVSAAAGALGPQQVDQLGPAAVAIAIEDEVREQQPTLPPRQGRRQGAIAVIDPHRPTQPYGPPIC